jgi:hypothetical protein
MHYFVEITDTFAGDANYSWATRHKVKASSMRGAVVRINRDSGLGFHKVDDLGDCIRYDSHSGATCAFIEQWDDERHTSYSNVNLTLA